MDRIQPQPGQESVWDYPRPPRLELCTKKVLILLDKVVIAASSRSQRVLETSHPPVYYIPPEDIALEYLEATTQQSYCEWKGVALYYNIKGREKAAWFYPQPTAAFAAIKDYVAFYPAMMDECYVGEERVQPQPGGFYGGWITSDIVGPFKGEVGSWGW